MANKGEVEVEIESGIKIPAQTRAGKWKKAAEKMKEGDSVLFADRQEAAGLINAIKRSGSEAVTRTELDGDGDNVGVRVWKSIAK